jgi:hypothetical protein
MNFAISWVLGLFKKPEVEVSFDKAEIKAWPFPVEKEIVKKPAKKPVKKTTTRKPATKKTAVKKATKVTKKAK